MTDRFIAAFLAVCLFLIGSSPLFAQDGSRLLTGAERRAYHACLYAAFITDYCQYNAWGSSIAAYRECVRAHGVTRFRGGAALLGTGHKQCLPSFRSARSLRSFGR